MNLFGLSGLLVGITSLSMAMLLFFKGKKKLNYIWAWYSFCCSIWGFGAFFISNANTYELSFRCWQFAYIGVIPLPVLFLHFISLFLGLRRNKLIFAAYCLTIFFEFTNIFYSKLFFGEIKYVFDQFFWTTSSGLFLNIYTAVFILGIVTYCHYELIKAVIRTKPSLRRKQIKYFLIGTALGWMGGLFCFMLNYNLYIEPFGRFYPLGNFAIILYPIIYTYAIIRYQLMDITLVIKKGLIYSILLTVLTLLYFSIIFIGEKFLQGLVGYQSHYVSLVSACVIAILFNPLRSWIQHFLDHYFFKGTLESLAQEKEKLKNELFHTEKLAYVGKLASSVVHEIKNPLTAIKSFCEHAPENFKEGEFKIKFEQLIPKEINRIEKTLSQLLDLAKPHAPKIEEVNLVLLIDFTLNLLENNFLQKTIKVKREYVLEDLFIEADQEQLKQVFLNLFLNAIDSMDKGGILTVNLTANDKNIEITIQDTGKGIAPEDLKHIFTPFFTTKEHGIGLGLVITQEIIKNHGGKIKVESALDQGTRFEIQLPMR